MASGSTSGGKPSHQTGTPRAQGRETNMHWVLLGGKEEVHSSFSMKTSYVIASNHGSFNLSADQCLSEKLKAGDTRCRRYCRNAQPWKSRTHSGPLIQIRRGVRVGGEYLVVVLLPQIRSFSKVVFFP